MVSILSITFTETIYPDFYLISMLTYRQVCTCESQPCWICFLMFDLIVKEIEWMLDE